MRQDDELAFHEGPLPGSLLDPEQHYHLLGPAEQQKVFEEHKDKVPAIDASIVEWLRAVFPATLYSPADSMESIMFSSGQQDVINTLRKHYLHQQTKES
jgi:hypothetical protein|tara:strand:- start:77 stop:373 length:297 start_codon:yes stop_codon:yes gene_type:complete